MKNKWREISPKNPGFRLVCLFELWSRSSIVKIIAFAVWHPVVTKETWGEWMDARLSQHHTNNNWEQTFRLSYNCIRFTVIVKWNWLIGLVQWAKAKTSAIPFDHHCTKTTMDVTDISKLILIGSIIRICTSIRARHCFKNVNNEIEVVYFNYRSSTMILYTVFFVMAA